MGRSGRRIPKRPAYFNNKIITLTPDVAIWGNKKAKGSLTVTLYCLHIVLNVSGFSFYAFFCLTKLKRLVKLCKCILRFLRS